MTEEVDPRLVALGLVPAPTAPQEAGQGWETAAPPKPTDWVIPTAPGVAPPPPPQETHAPPPPKYAPPSYTVTPVAPRAPEAPVREAPPPLPKFAAAMPTPTKAVEAPAIPTKKEKAAKPKKEKAAKAAKAPKPAVVKPERVKPAPKPRFVLPPSGVLLRGPIVMGYPEQKLQITLEQLGFRINAKEPIDVAWTDVREIKSRRGRVVVRTRGRRGGVGIPV